MSSGEGVLLLERAHHSSLRGVNRHRSTEQKEQPWEDYDRPAKSERALHAPSPAPDFSPGFGFSTATSISAHFP
jgi:hypothetical protein